MLELWKQWREEVLSAFLKPTIKQKEVLGRFLHALSVASFIGAVTVLFSSHFTLYTALRSLALFMYGVTSLIIGLIIGKGE